MPRASAKYGVSVDFGVGRNRSARDRAKQHGHVEHVVVQREVARRNMIDPAALLQLPVLLPQLRGGCLQLCVIDIAAPERFQRVFEFALLAPMRGKPRLCAMP